MANLQDSMIVKKPEYWQSKKFGNYDGTFNVSSSTKEYDQVEELIKSSGWDYRYRLGSVHRVQNYNFYCQFLCRREHYARSPINYYTVRRFVVIPKRWLNAALVYNLDPRRFNINVTKMFKTLNSYVCSDDDVVLVVNVITKSPCDEYYNPYRSTDYYIEYIIYFD